MLMRVFVMTMAVGLMLAGCGGGGGGGAPNIPPSDAALLAAGQTGSRDLLNITVDTASSDTTDTGWSLTYPATVTRPGANGTLDAAAGTVTFSGLQATLGNPAGSDYVLTTAESGTIGVVGELTDAGAVPATDSATYSGRGTAVVLDDGTLHELTGPVTVSVDFGTAAGVDIAFRGMSGQSLTGAGSAAVSGHRMDITGATQTGNRITGGTFSYPDGQYATDVTAGGSLDHAGGVFGPLAEEVAGAAGYDARGIGLPFAAFMTYVGKK